MRGVRDVRRARELEITQSGKEQAADMRLVEVDEDERLGRYLMRGKKFSWAEVVVLRNGSVLVHGDVDTVLFGYRYPTGSPRDVIEWMATAESDYAREKASIGTSRLVAEDFDRDVARAFVIEYRRGGVLSAQAARAAFESLDRLGDAHDLAQALYEHGAGLDSYELGTVTSQTVLYGQVILRRLLELLGDLDANEPTPDGWFSRLVQEEPSAAAPPEEKPPPPASEQTLESEQVPP